MGVKVMGVKATECTACCAAFGVNTRHLQDKPFHSELTYAWPRGYECCCFLANEDVCFALCDSLEISNRWSTNFFSAIHTRANTFI
jgi:hypothetical protein